jgi:hypothetical protein
MFGRDPFSSQYTLPIPQQGSSARGTISGRARARPEEIAEACGLLGVTNPVKGRPYTPGEIKALYPGVGLNTIQKYETKLLGSTRATPAELEEARFLVNTTNMDLRQIQTQCQNVSERTIRRYKKEKREQANASRAASGSAPEVPGPSRLNVSLSEFDTKLAMKTVQKTLGMAHEQACSHYAFALREYPLLEERIRGILAGPITSSVYLQSSRRAFEDAVAMIAQSRSSGLNPPTSNMFTQDPRLIFSEFSDLRPDNTTSAVQPSLTTNFQTLGSDSLATFPFPEPYDSSSGPSFNPFGTGSFAPPPRSRSASPRPKQPTFPPLLQRSSAFQTPPPSELPQPQSYPFGRRNVASLAPSQQPSSAFQPSPLPPLQSAGTTYGSMNSQTLPYEEETYDMPYSLRNEQSLAAALRTDVLGGNAFGSDGTLSLGMLPPSRSSSRMSRR